VDTRRVLVDSNVLLDVIGGHRSSGWESWSTTKLEEVGNEAELIINAIVFGEVSVRFETLEELDVAVPRDIFRREAIPFEASFLAAKCFKTYRARGGERSSPIPDFYIGAHAAIGGYRLMTRDSRRYRTYFPKLELIAPA
jgi:predicted nucleic acid-binding protein